MNYSFVTFYLRRFLGIGLVTAVMMTVVAVPLAVSADLILQNTDRILILAPHPDDETLGTGGIIQEAVARKLPLRIVYFTYGDNNELSFILYKKRPILGRNGLLKMGEQRRQEAVAAMTSLGVNPAHLIFLGYPDFRTMNILTAYWGKTKPLKGMLTRVNKVPYKDAYSPGAPYIGESILKDLKQILIDFKPTKIFVTLPADSNQDHRALPLFLQVALWDLYDRQLAPEVYPFLIHSVHWPQPRGYHPEMSLDPPERLSYVPINWVRFPLSTDQLTHKYEAIRLYKTQIKYSGSYLESFARSNELFGQLEQIPLKDVKSEEIAWDQLELIENIRGHIIEEKHAEEHYIDAVTYAEKDGLLEIRLRSPRFANKLLGFSLYLLCYRHDVPFAEMPKIKINIAWGRKVKAFNHRSPIFFPELRVKKENQQIIISLPITSLEKPHYIMTSVRAYLLDLPVEATAWRILTRSR